MKLKTRPNETGASFSQQLAMRTFLRPFKPVTLEKISESDKNVNAARIFVEKELFGSKIESNPIVLQRNPMHFLANGFVYHTGKVAYLGKNVRTNVHELIHLKDVEMRKEMPDNPFLPMNLFYLEGRACFGASLFVEPQTEAKQGLPEEMNIMGVIRHLSQMLVAITRTLFFLVKYPIYSLFYNSMVKMAREIGDPVRTFKLTTEKHPGIRGIISPKKFYRDEMAAAKKEMEETKQNDAAD